MSFADLLSPAGQTAAQPALPYNPTDFGDVVADAFTDATYRQPFGRVAFAEADASVERKRLVRERFGQDAVDFTGVRRDYPGLAETKFEEVDRRLDQMILTGRQTEPDQWQGIRTIEEIQAASRDAAQVARLRFEETAQRASPLARVFGSLIGGIGGAFTDPINLATLPLGVGAGTGILRAMATEGVINMAVEAVESPFVAQWQNELGFKYGLGEAALDIGTAGVGGAALTGIIRSVGPALRATGSVSMRALDTLSRSPRLPREARGAAQYLSRVAHIDEEMPGINPRRASNFPELAAHREAVQETQEALRSYREPDYQMVFHGTPHTFTRFSTDRIGTGEGAQAYGWGLYLTDNKAIAERFQRKLSDAKGELRDRQGNPFQVADDPMHTTAARMALDARGIDAAIRQVEELLPSSTGAIAENQRELVTLLQEWKTQGITVREQAGNLYEVAIPTSDRLLDWNLPLTEQSPQVKGALLQAGLEPTSASGAHIYRALEAKLGGPQAASTYLRSLGIPGHRYPAEMQRGKRGEADYNYVIYDDAEVSIRQPDDTDLAQRPVQAAASLEQTVQEASGLADTERADFARLVRDLPDGKLLVDGEEKTIRQIADELAEDEIIMNAIKTCGIG